MTTDELKELLVRLRFETEARLKASYDRSLPFADGLFDRWERAARLGFAEGSSIYNSSFVFGDVKVGRNTWIGPFTVLDGAGGSVSIGEFCSISAGVHIYTHDTVHWALSGGGLPKRSGPVAIGDRVYIGSQCVIRHGTTIGSGCVLAANSFINCDVAEGSIVGGSPARVIGRVMVNGGNIELLFDNSADASLLTSGGQTK